MIRKHISILFLSFLLIINYGGSAQIPYDFVKDLGEEWMVVKNDSLYPYLGKSSKVVHFPLGKEECNQCRLLILTKHKVTFYYKHKPVRILDAGTYFFSVDSLIGESNPPVWISLYSEETVEGINTYIVKGKIDPQQFVDSASIFSTPLRKKPAFLHHYVTILIVFLIGVALTKARYPKMFREYFLLTRTLSARNIEEILFKVRFLERYNVWMLSLHAALFSFLLISLTYLSGGMMAEFFMPEERLVNFLLKWLLLAAILFGLYIVKYFVLSIFNIIYSFDFKSIHFFNYMRYSLILGFALLVLTTTTFVGFKIENEIFYQTLIYIAAGLLAIRIAIVFLKLMRAHKHAILHLFSYLCATELIPFIFVIKVIF